MNAAARSAKDLNVLPLAVARARAHAFNDWLKETFLRLKVGNEQRHRMTAACLTAALSHFDAILLLEDKSLQSSAFALLRSEWEAVISGLYIWGCVTDANLDGYWNGTKKFPNQMSMITGVEEHEPFKTRRPFTVLRNDLIGSMNLFTHMSWVHIQRWNTPSGIEQSFSDEELAALLALAGNIALIAALGFSVMFPYREVIDALAEAEKALHATHT